MNNWNAFYDPYNWYGSDQNYYNTPISEIIGEQNPRGEWMRYMSGQGFGGTDRRSQWGYNQFGKMEDGYQAATMTNPNLKRREFYDQQTPQLEREWNLMAPSQRGEFMPAQTRWVRWT